MDDAVLLAELRAMRQETADTIASAAAGLRDLIETAVIRPLDDHVDEDRDFHGRIERRVGLLERSDSHAAGGRRMSGKWLTAVNAAIAAVISLAGIAAARMLPGH